MYSLLFFIRLVIFVPCIGCDQSRFCCIEISLHDHFRNFVWMFAACNRLLCPSSFLHCTCLWQFNCAMYTILAARMLALLACLFLIFIGLCGCVVVPKREKACKELLLTGYCKVLSFTK
jgi:hypothetical protein